MKNLYQDQIYLVEPGAVIAFDVPDISEHLLAHECGELWHIYRVVESVHLKARQTTYATIELYVTVPAVLMAVWHETFMHNPYIGLPSRAHRLKQKNRELEDTLNEVLLTTPWRRIGPEALDRAKKAINFHN